MCRKNTVALNTIYDMCSAQNLDPKEYILKAKLLLGSYRHICWASLGVCKVASDDDFYVCDENIKVGLDYLASYSPSEEKRNFEKQLKAMFDSSWMVQLVDDTMIQVKEFPDLGDVYFELLSKAYLSKFKYVEADLVELFKMDRSTFYDRKKEAVLVFALALWGTVLPRLRDILDETEWPD